MWLRETEGRHRLVGWDAWAGGGGRRQQSCIPACLLCLEQNALCVHPSLDARQGTCNLLAAIQKYPLNIVRYVSTLLDRKKEYISRADRNNKTHVNVPRQSLQVGVFLSVSFCGKDLNNLPLSQK